MSRKSFLLSSTVALLVLPGVACADGLIASGVDAVDGVVFNVDSDGDGPDVFAVLIGRDYDYANEGLPGDAQFILRWGGVILNRNTTISGTATISDTTMTNGLLDVNAGILGENFSVADNTGNTAIGGTLDAMGAISNSTGVVTINDAIKTTNAGGANLIVNDTAGVASLTSAATGQGLTVTGTTSTVLKGGTNSGILTLQDGDAAGGTNISISGSGGGVAATVFQTTTDANTTLVETQIGTSAVYANGSTATLQAGPNNAVTVNSGNAGADPGVSITGVVGTGSTSTTGVSIRGDGQNTRPYTAGDRAAGTVPDWADVGIYSKSYGAGDPTLGSAIIVTDYGIQLISPQPIAGQQITNNTGVNNSTGTIVNNNGSNTSSGSVINNNGMNSGSGSVVNNSGGTSGSGSATNNIGMNTSTTGGTSTNNIGGISGNGTATNGFGNNTSTSGGTANNSIGMNSGNGTVNNSFGGGSGSGPTSNTIGQNTGTGTLTNSIGNANTVAESRPTTRLA